MNQPPNHCRPENVIRTLRELCPPRALESHEAQGIAERQALRLLSLLEQHQPAVDISLLAELPNLQVRLRSRLPVSGFSQWTKGRWVIGINRDDHLLRRRFTLAHEFKHVLDDCYIDQLYLGADGRPDRLKSEAICDYFAACLLMPRPWVKSAWVQGVQDIGELAALFVVSGAAMSLRLRQLGLLQTNRRCRYGDPPTRRPYFRSAPALNTAPFVIPGVVGI